MTIFQELARTQKSPEDLAGIQIPKSMRAAVVEAADQAMFRDGTEKDVRKSIKIREVPIPELAPDEVLVAVMASAINFNTVWTALFEPISTFSFLRQLAKNGGCAKRHDQAYHVLGSDASGVIVKTGSNVKRWAIGDAVVVHTAYVDHEDPMGQQDAMLTDDLRAWGYETNFGGMAEFTIIKSTQLMPKAPHLSWEEAASIPLCGATAYRMLVSPNGARMKQGDVVLIWGATGGLGAFAVQLAAAGGALPIGIVGSEERVDLARQLGCHAVINRNALNLPTQDNRLSTRSWRILRSEIRDAIGEDPHIVFEYVGRATMGASVYLARKGGKIVTCGSSSGYQHEYDNRYLWMNLKSIIGCHGANYQEAWECNRLVNLGMLQPTLSETFDLDQAPEAVFKVQSNKHVGKVAVLCLAENPGEGIRNSEMRDKIGLEALNRFRARRS